MGIYKLRKNLTGRAGERLNGKNLIVKVERTRGNNEIKHFITFINADNNKLLWTINDCIKKERIYRKGHIIAIRLTTKTGEQYELELANMTGDQFSWDKDWSLLGVTTFDVPEKELKDLLKK